MGEVAIFLKGRGISKIDIVEDGEIECIRYGELYTEYNEAIINIKSRISNKHSNLVYSEYNDVIIPSSGETQLDIAKASCVLKKGIALGGDLNIIRTNENGLFLSYYLNYQKKMEIAKLSQGSSVVHLYSSQLKKLEIKIPCLEEQTKIANFLSDIDEKINQCQKGITHTQQYKKGILQQVFA